MRPMTIALALLGLAACARPTAGLQPIYPPVEYGFFARESRFTPVDSLQPTLRWEALESSGEAVTYEIRLWSAAEGQRGDFVYGRDGLETNDHAIEQALDPATDYVWSVRARFTANDARGLTEWGLAGDLHRDQAVPNPQCFRFRTPPA